MTDEDASLPALYAKLNDLKGTQASLQADLIRLQSLPTAKEVITAARHGRRDLPLSLHNLNEHVAQVEEKCILYRTVGWTVFEMDLDIGRRGRQQRRVAGTMSNEKEALGLGVRMETYNRGRFYEPFYLIFAKPSQELDAAKKPNAVRLLRHTIPHFVPLGEMIHSHLTPSSKKEASSARSGGLDLLANLMQRDGLDLFLSQLHAHLQSFVSRRQQAMALSQFKLPGKTSSSLRAFSNDSFGQLSIRWDMPSATEEDIEAFERTEGILYPNNDGSEAVEKPAKDPRSEGEINVAIEINIVYHDLSSDAIGRPAREVSKRRRMVEALDNTETPGLKCHYATILVESVQSRVPAARRGTSVQYEKLQVQRRRKTDWEMFFTPSHGTTPNLQDAFRTVADAAWKEELQRVILGTS
ncbi:hypothetical protein CBS101457_002094 [Exobasidium rhododendri]|nr:hypothetical protein CBS101457_002094 [Exobasidium rhododendri]